MKKIKYSLLVSFLFIYASLMAQDVLKGKILDKDGKPVVNAIVLIKGTKLYAAADTSGRFKISGNIKVPAKVQISSLGYKAQELNVADINVPLEINLEDEGNLGEVVVSSRRRQEVVQDIPIPISVISGNKVEDAGAFNVNRMKELVPSVQLYSSNGRNTAISIRGLGSPYGLTNDGIEPGVGYYIDGVYHARPAAATMDFVDLERIEILRGPQGTLFGKNTSAGAFNIFTKKPTIVPTGKVELSYGNYNFIQAKGSFSGGVAKNLAARLSLSGTQRTGTIDNDITQQHYNGLNNVGLKGQLYWTPNEKLEILFSADYNIQRPDGNSLVVADIIQTKREARAGEIDPTYRQYNTIVNDLVAKGYITNVQRPNPDNFGRKTYANSPWRHDQELGGAHINIDYKIGTGTLTSTSAWRYWNWDPSNDRDFTAIPALTKSQATSRHNQFSQEFRYSAKLGEKVSGVVGLYYLNQTLLTPQTQLEEVGPAQWRFQQNGVAGATNLALATPGLLDGYGIKTDFNFKSTSLAAFTQFDIEVVKGLHILPGLRFNYDSKDLVFSQTTYGGLVTTVASLIAEKRKVYTDQSFKPSTNNTNLSGNLTISYRPIEQINVYATGATSYKPIGLNVGVLPTKSIPGDAFAPKTELVEVKPEYTQHFEVGVKTKLFNSLILNATAYNTYITDYQIVVQDASVTRGYLSNAEKVNVKGFEIDAIYQYKRIFSANASLAYTDGKYVSFKNAPLPLEETGQTSVIDPNTGTAATSKDASGGRLPGISKWNLAGGLDYAFIKGNLLGRDGRFFVASDASYRSEYSSNPTPSSYLNIQGYYLVNARIGFRADNFSLFLWSRNLTGNNYYEQLQAASGNFGLVAGVLGDPRTYGITVRASF
jgi:iron complex outermembrane recepter protein